MHVCQNASIFHFRALVFAALREREGKQFVAKFEKSIIERRL